MHLSLLLAFVHRAKTFACSNVLCARPFATLPKVLNIIINPLHDHAPPLHTLVQTPPSLPTFINHHVITPWCMHRLLCARYSSNSVVCMHTVCRGIGHRANTNELGVTVHISPVSAVPLCRRSYRYARDVVSAFSPIVGNGKKKLTCGEIFAKGQYK